MSVSKKIRELIKSGMAEDEAIAQALGVPKSGSKKRSRETPEEAESQARREFEALPSMADAFKRSKVKKRKG